MEKEHHTNPTPTINDNVECCQTGKKQNFESPSIPEPVEEEVEKKQKKTDEERRGE